MARIRSLKIGFFSNDALAEMDALSRLLFAGLWLIADREGRLENRPKRIKAEILPYDNCDVSQMLKALEAAGFIDCYEACGIQCIQIVNFSKHQCPNAKEPPSVLPKREPISTGKHVPAQESTCQHNTDTVPTYKGTSLMGKGMGEGMEQEGRGTRAGALSPPPAAAFDSSDSIETSLSPSHLSQRDRLVNTVLMACGINTPTISDRDKATEIAILLGRENLSPGEITDIARIRGRPYKLSFFNQDFQHDRASLATQGGISNGKTQSGHRTTAAHRKQAEYEAYYLDTEPEAPEEP